MSTCNGYTNYQTWNVALWLNNDPVTRKHAKELISEMSDVNDKDELQGVTSLMANYIADMVEEMQEFASLPQTGLFADLLLDALNCIDYFDIAQTLLADALAERREAEKKGGTRELLLRMARIISPLSAPQTAKKITYPIKAHLSRKFQGKANAERQTQS